MNKPILIFGIISTLLLLLVITVNIITFFNPVAFSSLIKTGPYSYILLPYHLIFDILFAASLIISFFLIERRLNDKFLKISLYILTALTILTGGFIAGEVVFLLGLLAFRLRKSFGNLALFTGILSSLLLVAAIILGFLSLISLGHFESPKIINILILIFGSLLPILLIILIFKVSKNY